MDASPIEPQGSPRLLRLAPPGPQADRRPADPAADAGHLVDYLRILHKRRWTALSAFLIVVVAVTVYTFTATPVFEARTRLLIESDNPNVLNFQEVIDEQGTKADYYQTQYNILQSRALARRTLDQPAVVGRYPLRAGRRRLVRGPAAAGPVAAAATSRSRRRPRRPSSRAPSIASSAT